MTWIFDGCGDQYGGCVRQYTTFALSLLVLSLAFYSCLRTYKSELKLTSQLLPLLINTASSLILVALYSQMEVYNTRLILLVVEVYSYFILTYGFVSMVMRSKPPLMARLKTLNRFFVGVSGASVVAVVVLTILSTQEILQCKQDQGIGAVIIILLEIPLLLTTYVYSSKSKEILTTVSSLHPSRQDSLTTNHLLDQEDQFVKLKIVQLNLVRYAFIVTFVLHTIELACYYVGDEEIICVKGSSGIQVTNSLELYILTVENLSELFPHFIIPFIFCFIPAKMNRTAKTLYMSQPGSSEYQSRFNPSSPSRRERSNLVEDVEQERNIREKLTPKVQPVRLPTA